MGYAEDIPDEVPDELMHELLAPSYKAIALAILKNDLHFTSLGFTTAPSQWYSALKRMEIEARNPRMSEKDASDLEQLRLPGL